MEKHELVDINGNKTGKILTHVEARDPNNLPEGHYIAVVGVVIINSKNEILLLHGATSQVVIMKDMVIKKDGQKYLQIY